MIAIVEDDNNIRELVCYTLRNTGLYAEGFATAQPFFEFLKKEKPELVLLDIMLPDEDGISILKKLRGNNETSKIPVIMLTAKDSEYDKVIGLDSGADDYVTKPFGMMELVSRIRAVLRRTDVVTSKSVYSIGKLLLDDEAHLVTADNATIELTFKEYSLLKLLLINKGKVLTRDVLLQKIWGYDFYGETRTVDVHIRSLRIKLGICGDYIETVRGVGYKAGDVK